VQVLIDQGSFAQKKGDQLLLKLNQALDALNEVKVQKAIDKLVDFQLKTQDFINDGMLTAAQGQPFIDAAQVVINTIN
jgi:hypothetical protein